MDPPSWVFGQIDVVSRMLQGNAPGGVLSNRQLALRLLQIIALLLPLIGIFLQTIIRMEERDASWLTTERLHNAEAFTVVAAVALITAAILLVFELILEGVPLTILVSLILLYLAVLLVGIAVVRLLEGVHPKVPGSHPQQELSGWGVNERDEGDESDE